MDMEKIIKSLKERKTDFIKAKTFSKLPGIYAFFYIGNDFPVFGESVTKGQLIYIGKTESSQEKRNLKTHFTSGKTGSSTVRKSIGSLLCVQEKLVPIPRNDSDYKKGRYSHFKFDDPSEAVITQWMKDNLALSFYEFPKSKESIDKLETEIIQRLKPLLNIDHKNPENPYKTKIKQLRKNCATLARENSNFENNKPKVKSTKTSKTEPVRKDQDTSGGSGIIIDNITESDRENRRIRILVRNKFLFPTEKRGIPKTHILNFKVKNTSFEATYTIGSRDKKSRSGILKLENEIYQDILKIRAGDHLVIHKNGKEYSIEKIGS